MSRDTVINATSSVSCKILASFPMAYSVARSRKIKYKHKADGLQAVCLMFVFYLDVKGHGIK